MVGAVQCEIRVRLYSEKICDESELIFKAENISAGRVQPWAEKKNACLSWQSAQKETLHSETNLLNEGGRVCSIRLSIVMIDILRD